MPHPENVIGKGILYRSHDEATINNGRKGGVNSGKTRRARKEAREIAKQVLSFKPEIPEQMLDTIRRMGMKGKASPDMRYIATLAIMQKAMKGDVNSYRFLVELAGETDEALLMRARTEEATRHTGLMNAQLLDMDTSDLRERMDNLSDEDLATYERLCSILNPRAEGDDGAGELHFESADDTDPQPSPAGEDQ